MELAARWGDPLFSANAIQPRENYQVLIEHYRRQYAAHGHDPAHQYVGAGAGAGGIFLADTTQDARKQFGPVYEGLTRARNVPGNNSPFRDIDHAIAEGPSLVGSPEQVIDKILSYHQTYGHDLQAFSLPTTLPFDKQLEILERFALEVVPAVRAAAPTTLWEDEDPWGGRPRGVGAPEEFAPAPSPAPATTSIPQEIP